MSISGTTRMLGIIGNPISHTMSPRMHNAELKRLGLDYVYVAWQVAAENVPDVLRAMRALNIVGINVTIPHKEAVLPLLDEVVPDARIVGAVNTIKNDGGRLIGYNTDVPGWSADISQDIQLAGKRICVLGAGGAARAVCIASGNAGAAELLIVNRTAARKEQLATEVQRHFPAMNVRAITFDELGAQQAIALNDVVVNTTPIGMKSQPGCPIPKEWLRPHQYVYDTIYSTTDTQLMKAARSTGCTVRGGSGMLVRQGALSFQIWTGVEPSIEAMAAALQGAP
jgi:shikimate dehydrogenase